MTARIYPAALPNPVTPVGYDGTNFRALLVDTTGRPLIVGTFNGSLGFPLAQDPDGHLQVDALSSALPTGAATAANQLTEITALQLIDDLRNALGSVATDNLLVKAGLYGANPLALLVGPSGQLRIEPCHDGATWRSILTDTAGSPLVRAGYDGATWRALKTNTNANLINQPRPLKVVTATVALASVAAGATRNEVNINGAGIFLGVSMYIDGAALASVNTLSKVTIDGEGSPSISVRCNSYNNDLAGWTYAAAPTAANANTTPVGWGGQYDLPNFIFTGGYTLRSEFASSLLVQVTNGDGANATSIKTVTWYALWV